MIMLLMKMFMSCIYWSGMRNWHDEKEGINRPTSFYLLLIIHIVDYKEIFFICVSYW